MWQLQHVELNDGEALQSNLTSSMINHQQMQMFSVFKPTDLCGSYRIFWGECWIYVFSIKVEILPASFKLKLGTFCLFTFFET